MLVVGTDVTTGPEVTDVVIPTGAVGTTDVVMAPGVVIAADVAMGTDDVIGLFVPTGKRTEEKSAELG